jgi:hypothetical protein
MPYKVKVENNQTIWDLALRHYGSIDGAFKILQDNPTLDLDVDLVQGTLVNINQAPLNKDVINYLIEKGVNPATKA